MAAPRMIPKISRARAGTRLSQLIELHSSKAATPVTVHDLYSHGVSAKRDLVPARLSSARLLYRELPIRLAHRIRELEGLPLGLAEMPSVVEVAGIYRRSFAEIVQSPTVESAEDEQHFSEQLKDIRNRHDSVVKLIARGVLELKERHSRRASSYKIRCFLDSFYMSQIGLRVIMSHHLHIGDPKSHGIINTTCNPAFLATAASDAARSLAYQHYGEAPDVEIEGNMDITFPYLDRHIFNCLFELLKNSIRATIETHGDADALPPVKLIIFDGAEDITIKISDKGGGFRRSDMNRVWAYLFTTAKRSAHQLLENEERSMLCDRPDPIAGFGFGLPLSRLYARYWGGDLSLTSMEGFGSDAYLHLSKLGNKRECPSGLVPVYGQGLRSAMQLVYCEKQDSCEWRSSQEVQLDNIGTTES